MKINFKNKITCPVEILRKFSFGIAFTYLITILFGLLLPFTRVFAEEGITIIAEPGTEIREKEIIITAQLPNSSTRLNTKVYFYSYPTVEGFNDKAYCIPDKNWSCYVKFKSSTGGIYKIDANYFDNSKTKHDAKSINVQICKASENLISSRCVKSEKTLECTAGTVLNETKDDCVPNPAILKPEDKPKNTDTTYTPLAPLPGGDADGGLMKTINTQEECAFGKYLNIIIKLIIGISAVLAMVMITMGGIEYLTSELSSEKASGKDTIQNALLGLVMVMGAYLILNTINPQLLNVCLDKLPEAKIEIDFESEREYRLSQTITTDTKFKKTTYYDKIKTISTANNIPNCLLQVAIQRESNGVPNQIGHDENVPHLGVPSRKSFINSGVKYDKTKFTPNNDLVTNGNFKNNDSKLGIDWRFSHSVGLFGVTFGPNHGGHTGAQEILNNVDKDIGAAVKIMKGAYESCGKDIEKTFRMYQSGSCNGGQNNPKAFVNKETPLRVNLYNQCIKS